jgi:hypothetical protein
VDREKGGFAPEYFDQDCKIEENKKILPLLRFIGIVNSNRCIIQHHQARPFSSFLLFGIVFEKYIKEFNNYVRCY